MANHMAEVAKMLGVELGEEFECNDGYQYVFTDNRLMSVTSDVSEMLINLLTGSLIIKHKPLKPSFGDAYWTVMRSGTPLKTVWYDNLIDIHCYRLGNCYHTKEEAEANLDKWISFYSSDEILEV